MSIVEYWNALGRRNRIGLAVGAVLIVAGIAAAGVWLLRDPYVTLAAGLSDERLSEIARQLDQAKLTFRIDDALDAVAVPRSQVGKARAVSGSGPSDAPPSVGLELFKETDFSTTDFAQRINYQRALQGEITRTLQTIDGVRSARVHVILPEGGVFKRSTAKPTAAVSLTLEHGVVLTRTQVRGIQRLVAASVPEISVDDVVVLDETGVSLTRAGTHAEGDLSSAQLDLKRQADQYLEEKIRRLLQDLLPPGAASLSVDATLDDKQLKVTTEEPVAARAARDSSHAAGVLVRERQSQRGRPSGLMQTGGEAGDPDSTDWEYEYKVGNRTEQSLSMPGAIKRISVAVALRGAPAVLTSSSVEDLIGHAVGLDPERGDSVMVMLLPNPQLDEPVESPVSSPDAASSGTVARGHAWQPAPTDASSASLSSRFVLGSAVVIVLALMLGAWARGRRRVPMMTPGATAAVDPEAVVAKVRQWLSEGGGR